MSSIPQVNKPYNVRLYHLGNSREGVFLRRVVTRKSPLPKPEKAPSPQIVKPNGETGCPEPVSECGSTSPILGARSLSPDTLKQAAQRAKTKLRRLIEANGLNVMWSVTFDTNEVAKVRTRQVKGNLGDWEVARRHFALFTERVRRECKRRGWVFDFVATEEQQKRGTQHFHFASKLPFRHAEMLALWGYGTVRFSGGRASRRRDRRRPGSEAVYVARYVSKYLTKEFEAGEGSEEEGRGFHKARYYRSRQLALPFTEELIEPGDMTAFRELMEAGGFRVAQELAVEKCGIEFGWWAKALLVAVSSGDLTPGGEGAERADPSDGGEPPHLTHGQVGRMNFEYWRFRPWRVYPLGAGMPRMSAGET